MSRHLLLHGESGVGKTTLLIERLAPYRYDCSGFITRRLWKDGQTQGFCLTPVSEAFSPAAGFNADIPGIFLERTGDGWKRNDSVFLAEGLRCLSETDGKRFIVLDEIGGIELMSARFYTRLRELFSGGTPCIGVLKSGKNHEAMCRELGLSREYRFIREEFQEFLSGLPAIQFIAVSRDNCTQASECIRSFILNSA